MDFVSLVNLFGAFGWLVGVVSGFIQLKSYFEQKRFEKAYLNVFEQAKRDWEGKYTEEQVGQLTGELARLRKLIENDVPRQAKRAFLEDQLIALSENLSDTYSRYIYVSDKLGQQNTSSTLPLEMMHVIEETIIPSYKIKQRRQTAIVLLLIFALLLLMILSFPFFVNLFSLKVRIGATYPLGWLFSFGFIVLTGIYAFSAVSRGRLERWMTNHPILSRILLVFSWIISLALLLLLMLASESWLYWTDPDIEDWLWRLAGAAFVATPLSFSILTSFYLVSDPLAKIIARRRQM